LGEGPERGSLERLIDAYGLRERVTLLGQVQQPGAYLLESELFVLSSRHEGFPNALCEAMACGLAAVSFDCPAGPRHIIRHGADGLLVPAGDVQALSREMSSLMSDSLLRRRLGNRAAEVSARFDATEIFPVWEKVLREVVAQGEGFRS
jgi:glycosyltransferase involved in cell wall biosynthesis